MSDFTSDFWSWWIITIVVGGIVFCIWLLLGNKKSTLPAGGKAEATGHVWDEDLEELNNPLPRWWIIKFYITIVFGIAYLALYPGLGTFEGILGWTDRFSDHRLQHLVIKESDAPIVQESSLLIFCYLHQGLLVWDDLSPLVVWQQSVEQ